MKFKTYKAENRPIGQRSIVQ